MTVARNVNILLRYDMRPEYKRLSEDYFPVIISTAQVVIGKKRHS